MSLATPTCPVCATALVLTNSATFDSWVCREGHGLAMTLSEGYERMQEDELSLLWKLARTAPGGAATRRSPMTGRPMTAVEVPWDLDEVPEGEPGDGANVGSIWVDVDLDEQLIWLDAGELERFPADLPDSEPAAEELARIDEIRAVFGEAIVDADESRQAHDISERICRKVAAHKGLSRVLTGVGSLGRR